MRLWSGRRPSSCPSDMPGARCLPERLLGVAAARALCSRERQRPAHRPHHPDSSASRGTYGALRIQAELKARGLGCGHNRVARLMRQAGWWAAIGGGRCTYARRGATRRRPQHLIWSSAPLPHLLQIGSGSQISRICRPSRRGFFTWLPFWMCSVAEWSAGRCRTICTPNWSWQRWRWR